MSNEKVKKSANGFVRKKSILLPTISLKKMKEGDSRFFEALAEIKIEKDVDPKTNKVRLDTDTQEEMLIKTLHVVDLETGEEGNIVVGFLVVKALDTIKSLKGYKFEMLKGGKSNRTQLWTVYELEL